MRKTPFADLAAEHNPTPGLGKRTMRRNQQLPEGEPERAGAGPAETDFSLTLSTDAPRAVRVVKNVRRGKSFLRISTRAREFRFALSEKTIGDGKEKRLR
jgi:hypothetical protein